MTGTKHPSAVAVNVQAPSTARSMTAERAPSTSCAWMVASIAIGTRARTCAAAITV